MFYLWLSICLCVSLLWVCGCICISLCSSLALIFLFSWSSPFPTPSSPQETRMVIYTGFHINCWKYHPEPGLEYVCSGRLTLTGVLDPHRPSVTWHPGPDESLRNLVSSCRAQCSRWSGSKNRPGTRALISDGSMPVQSPLCRLCPSLSQGQKGKRKTFGLDSKKKKKKKSSKKKKIDFF